MEFKTVLKRIKKSQKHVDKVLKAAKLQRCEKQGLSEETFFAMFCMTLMFGFAIALFVFG